MLHCLCGVTGLKGEHATHCGEPDCSGVIDRLPGVIQIQTGPDNSGRNTGKLLSPASSRRRGESSPLPNTGY